MAVATSRSNGGRLRIVVAAALVLLLGALIAFGVVVYGKYRDKKDRGDERIAAVAAARVEAVNLTTIDYRKPLAPPLTEVELAFAGQR